MKIPILIEVEVTDVARNAAAVRTDLRQLIVDSLQASLQRNPSFQVEIKTANAGKAKAEPLCNKSDVAQYYGVSIRQLDRWRQEGRIPEPIRIAAPHCPNGAPRWFPGDIQHARHD